MSENGKVGDSDPAEYRGLRISLIKLGLLLLCASFCLLLLLLNAALAWWLLLILALPIHLVSEWVGDKVFATKYGWSTEQVGFSPKRIALGVLLVLSLSAGVYLVFRLFN
jgi:hypothetical protein